jgi:hypothetical protein
MTDRIVTIVAVVPHDVIPDAFELETHSTWGEHLQHGALTSLARSLFAEIVRSLFGR